MSMLIRSVWSDANHKTALLILSLIVALVAMNIPLRKAHAANTLVSAVYQDGNTNGTVDRIRLTFDENVTACAYEAGDWTVNTAGSITVVITGLTCTGANAILDVNVTADANETGGATAPVISYDNVGTAGSVTLTSGAMTAKPNMSATDGASPRVLTATYLDTNADARVDRVRFNTTTDVGIVCTAFTGGVGFTVGTAGTVTLAAAGGDTCGNATTTSFSISLATLGTANTTGGGTAPVVTYTQPGNGVEDGAGNDLPTAAGVTVADGAAPVAIVTTPVSGATGVLQTAGLVADFSESITIGGCILTVSPNPGAYDSITTGGNWSAGTGQASSRITLNHSTTLYDVGSTISVTISGCTDGTNTVGTGPIPNPWTFTIALLGGGGGSNAGTYTPSLASVTVVTPNGGATYAAGGTLGVEWTAMNGNYSYFAVLYSGDNGSNWTTVNAHVDGSSRSSTWIVSSVASTQGLIKVEGYDNTDTLVASDVSNAVFGVNAAPSSTVTPPPAEQAHTAAPATDSTVAGTYTPTMALTNTPDIDTDKNITAVSGALCEAGSLIKGSFAAVYYCGKDGKRYVFVNDKAFFTWYNDFSTVKILSDATISSIPIGGNITYRPGKKMIKIQSDPRVYVIARGGTLRWVATEVAAVRLFGNDWNKQIDDISDAFFVNYHVGDAIMN